MWQNAAAVPKEESTFIVPNGIDRSHFIIIIQHEGVYRYDFNNNAWNRYDFINELPADFEPDCFDDYQWLAATLDINGKTLYFFNECDQMAEIKIIDKEQNEWNITKRLINSEMGSQSIIIKDKLHLIGGWENNKHSKYNPKLSKVDVMHTFNDFDKGFCYHQIVSVNDNMFVFGGYDSQKRNYLDTIYHCNVDENVWNKLNIKMPKQLHSFGCTTAINNKYILIFGGETNDDRCIDEIYVFSLLNRSFTKSKVRCPEKGIFKAITINDTICDEMVVCGYVREQWKLSEIADHYFPPRYLLKMMCSYYLTEHIHLINRDNGKHWTMNTFDIVS